MSLTYMFYSHNWTYIRFNLNFKKYEKFIFYECYNMAQLTTAPVASSADFVVFNGNYMQRIDKTADTLAVPYRPHSKSMGSVERHWCSHAMNSA